MHNRIPLSRGLGSSAAATVGGVVLGRCARVRGRARRPSPPLRPAPDRDDDRVAPGQRRGGAARRVRRVGAARPSGSRRSGSTRPTGCSACCSSRTAGSSTEEMRRVLPGRGPAARRGGEHGPGRDRGRGDRGRPLRAPRRPHRRPAPRAVPQRPVPGAAAAHARGARGGGAGRVPVGRGLDDLRVRRAGRRTRRRSRRRSGRGGRVRPRRAGPRSWRRATAGRRSAPPEPARAAPLAPPDAASPAGGTPAGRCPRRRRDRARARPRRRAAGSRRPTSATSRRPSSSWFSSARTFADASVRSIHRTVVALRSLRRHRPELGPAARVEALDERLERRRPPPPDR